LFHILAIYDLVNDNGEFRIVLDSENLNVFYVCVFFGQVPLLNIAPPFVFRDVLSHQRCLFLCPRFLIPFNTSNPRAFSKLYLTINPFCYVLSEGKMRSVVSVHPKEECFEEPVTDGMHVMD
jgi:hypothetical protein